MASSEHTTGTPEPPTRGTTTADAEITCEQYTGEDFARVAAALEAHRLQGAGQRHRAGLILGRWWAMCSLATTPAAAGALAVAWLRTKHNGASSTPPYPDIDSPAAPGPYRRRRTPPRSNLATSPRRTASAATTTTTTDSIKTITRSPVRLAQPPQGAHGKGSPGHETRTTCRRHGGVIEIVAE